VFWEQLEIASSKASHVQEAGGPRDSEPTFKAEDRQQPKVPTRFKVATFKVRPMNLTDRIYIGVHVALTLLVCARWQHVGRAPLYLAWSALAIAAILITSRKQHSETFWQFAHDWLPAIFFITAFEEVSFLALIVRGGWQNAYLLRLESALVPVASSEWMYRFNSSWVSEMLELGYFTFYPIYPVLGGVFWARRHRAQLTCTFRSFTDSLSVGYALCYATYLLFPTRSPLHNERLPSVEAHSVEGGPFHFLVRSIQSRAGVYGNAFPSAHIMVACVALVFAFRYFPRIAPVLLICVLLMCVGAVYDGYHYVVDVLAGAGLGIVVGIGFVTREVHNP
jgi:membrane-associated phospholipid phosphatase